METKKFTEIYVENNPERDHYQMQKNLSKHYAGLTKKSLESMIELLDKFKDNKDDLKYLIRVLNLELED